ncbi:AMP-binding enzyme [Penicillium taxi]|uniref:AMP-binding enzyme n=1 Tax=Penicillium taxi TaxID=168475 RepID=UPI002544E84A|nr:AMP-binding enzyme [Penicillium taxi]KAJ5894098.1 AMP-binding enzyme [Penicillium taxi]
MSCAERADKNPGPRGFDNPRYVRVHGQPPTLEPSTKKFGPYQWLTYETVQKRRAVLGAGLVELHHKHDCFRSGQFGVSLWSLNRPEWQLTDLACMSQSLYTVSIYDVLAPDAAEYIINHAELNYVVASLPHLPTLIKLKPLLPNLKIVVYLDSLDVGEKAGHSKRALFESMAAGQEVAIYTIDKVEALGEASRSGYHAPSPSVQASTLMIYLPATVALLLLALRLVCSPSPTWTIRWMTSHTLGVSFSYAAIVCSVRPYHSNIDRRKNVLKLAQDEYISSERLESVILSEIRYLTQAYVHEDSMQTFLVALFGVHCSARPVRSIRQQGTGTCNYRHRSRSDERIAF